MEIHKLIESIKQEVGDEIRETLTVEFMQASNNITNSNASLQENMKKLIEVSIAEWKVKLKYAVNLLYTMIGFIALMTGYMVFTRDKVEKQVQANKDLLIESRKLLEDEQELIKDDHKLIEETRRLIEENIKK
jgi:hypothetical protein